MKKCKKLAPVLALLALAACLTQCVQAPQTPTEGLGSQIPVDEVTEEDIVIKDEGAGEDAVVDFGGAEATQPDGVVTEPDTSQGFGEFF